MKARDIATGLIIIIVIISAVLLVKNSKKNKVTNLPASNFQQVESKFPGLTVPANADKTSLTDVSGGIGMGEAIRGIKNGLLSLTVLADLEAPKSGYFYQAWLFNGSSYLSLGRMELGKGGYIIDFSSSKYYSDYKKVVVTLEKAFNSTPETHVLEGSF